jgi:hypothetical protein
MTVKKIVENDGDIDLDRDNHFLYDSKHHTHIDANQIPICRDCKWFYAPGLKCKRTEFTRLDIVTGAKSTFMSRCADERKTGQCGIRAGHFARKDQ